MSALPLIAVALASAIACSDGDVSTADAGVDSGTSPLVAPPDIPWLAEGVPPLALAPCPEGWRAVTDEVGVTTCDPYPEGGALDCADGDAHFPGEPGCRPIGAPCPAGAWPEDLPASGVVFIQAGATGGDGSRAAPFGTFGEAAIATRPAGTVIALAKGTYEGVLPLRAGVTVTGACVAETRVTGTDAPVTAVITVTSRGEPATVRNLTIADPPQGGVRVENGRSLVLDGVRISRAPLIGVLAKDAGSRLDATDLVIDDTQRPPGERFGLALIAQLGGEIHAGRLLVRRSADFGIAIAENATVTVSDAAVTESIQSRGVTMQDGAVFVGTRLLVSGNHGAGIGAVSGCAITLADAVIADQEEGTFAGRGITLEEASTLDASRLLVARSRETGIHIGGVGTRATLTDVVVRDTRPDGDGTSGRGVTVQGAAQLDATRLVVSGSLYGGVFGAEAGTSLSLTDTAILDTRPQESDGEDGRGLTLQMGARGTATRLVVSEAHEIAVSVGDPESALVLEDVVLRGTLPEPDGRYGYGILAQRGASLDATRALVSTVRELGVIAYDRASITGRDVTIDSVARSSSSDPSRVFGHGAAAAGGTLTLDRFTSADAATCGLFVSDFGSVPGALDVANGIVERAAIGACIQIEDYDLDRLRTDVVYRDNDSNLDSTMLPVPMPPNPG